MPNVALFLNPSTVRRTNLLLPWWCRADAAFAPLELLRACPIYRPTPLVRLSSLARALGLGALFVKDESERLRLGSFKALGGIYAVLRTARQKLEAEIGRKVSPATLLLPELRDKFRHLTICCASDGNHGRSIAAGARLIGAKCVVFLPAGVSNERAAHIERLGAEIMRSKGSYDRSVAAAQQTAREREWMLIADTAVPEDEKDAELCGLVMQGYTVLVSELLGQLASQNETITHVFVQAGVGGLAASVLGHWTAHMAPELTPRFIVVEPERAASLLASARAGAPTRIPEEAPTIMAMLECQSPSPLAWPVVERLASAFVAVGEEEARSAVRRLAAPQNDDPRLEIGESGAAGLAGVTLCLRETAWRKDLELDHQARVLVIATEGPTDRSSWSGAQ